MLGYSADKALVFGKYSGVSAFFVALWHGYGVQQSTYSAITVKHDDVLKTGNIKGVL